MNAIVAVNSDWGIGCCGRQVVVLPEDRKFFKEMTSGGVIISGRKTFEDFPGPLPNRKNIVLSKDSSFRPDGVTVLNSLEQVLDETRHEEPDKVFVVGGGMVYEQFLPYCGKAYVTKLDAVPESDTYFENLDEHKNWSIEREMRSGESAGIAYTIYLYTRKF